MRVRIYDLANELDVKNSDVIDACKKIGVDINSHMAVLEPETADKVRQLLPKKKKMTKPWDADNNPFSLDMLRLKKKREGFRPRFVAQDNIQKHLDQGWQFANIKDYGGVTDKLPGEEGKTDTLVKRRELILMELPEELGKKRDEYIDYKTNIRRRQINQKVAAEVAAVERQLGEKVDFTQTSESSQSVTGRRVIET